MKKSFLALLILVVMLSAGLSSVYAKQTKPYDHGYYDAVTGYTIAAVFEVGSDGQLHEIPIETFVTELQQGRRIENEFKQDTLSVTTNSQINHDIVIQPEAYNYYYYDYTEFDNYVYTSESYVKASASIYCNSSTPCPITATNSNTISASFSTNVKTSEEKSAIEANVGFSFQSSATRSSSYQMSVPVDKQAFIAFYPKYNYRYGTLDYYHQYGSNTSLVDSDPASVSSPKMLSSGEPDGVYALIYEN